MAGAWSDKGLLPRFCRVASEWPTDPEDNPVVPFGFVPSHLKHCTGNKNLVLTTAKVRRITKAFILFQGLLTAPFNDCQTI